MKYRLWDTNEQVMIESWSKYNSPGSKYFKRLYVDLDGTINAQYVAMFCSGLKDSNGNEIYEGDLVGLVGFDERGEVTFTKGVFWIIHSNSHTDELLNSYDSHMLTVVGHIYEDKENAWEWSLKERKAAIIQEAKSLLDKLCDDCQKLADDIVRGKE